MKRKTARMITPQSLSEMELSLVQKRILVRLQGGRVLANQLNQTDVDCLHAFGLIAFVGDSVEITTRGQDVVLDSLPSL